MAKNYMADVAKLLGVELDEEFKYEGLLTFGKITERGFMRRNQGERFVNVYNSDLVTFLTGFNKIEKLPWKPKSGEEYHFVSWYCENGKNWRIGVGNTRHWNTCYIDCLHVDIGNCFKTYAEAEAHKYEVFKRLTGKDWHETYGKEGDDVVAN